MNKQVQQKTDFLFSPLRRVRKQFQVLRQVLQESGQKTEERKSTGSDSTDAPEGIQQPRPRPRTANLSHPQLWKVITYHNDVSKAVSNVRYPSAGLLLSDLKNHAPAPQTS